MNIAIIAPHPDDEIIGVGGTIVKHVKNGDDVYVIVVTKGDSKFYPNDYVMNGRKQQAIADKMLGVKEIKYLDFPSPLLDTLPHTDVVQGIEKALLRINPDVIYIPHYGDMHVEHRLISECCMVALRPKAFKDIEIYGYEVPSETGWNIPCQHNEFIPNMYVKLDDDEFDMKMKALEIFDSQMNEYPSARSVRAIGNLAEYRGNTIGTEYAEAFMVIRMQRS